MALSVSVVTPSLNQGRFIERTIRSVLDQNVPGLEYVVMDGGSTDGTREILRNHEPNVRWTSEADNGQAHAVNKAIARTSGRIIGWLNSDDVYYPDAVRIALEAFSDHPEADVVYGRADHIDEDDNVIGPYPTRPWNFDRLLETCYLSQPAVFFRRRVVDRFGGLDDHLRYCMDYEYWLRLARGGAVFHFVDRRLAGTRLHGDTKTLSRGVEVHEEVNDMLRARLGAVPGEWLLRYAKAYCRANGPEPEKRLRFAVASLAASVGAARRWNGRVSRDLICKGAKYGGQYAWAVLKSAFKRRS